MYYHRTCEQKTDLLFIHQNLTYTHANEHKNMLTLFLNSFIQRNTSVQQ
jgi:hypothetical protein